MLRIFIGVDNNIINTTQMSKQKLKHIRSAVAGKSPTPEQLDYGVIAVNFNAEEPFLSIKDSNDQIAKFPSEAAIAGVISGQVESVVEEVLPTVVGENYPTKTEVNDEINALSAATDTKLEQKANVSDIPSLDGYATENWVQEQGYLTEHQSLDGYATEQWVTDQHYLTEHQDISGLATKQELSEGLSGKSNTGHTHTVSDITNFPTIPSATSDLNNDSGFITSDYTYSKTESDNKYALKGDVPTDVYTKQETDEAISGATQDMATKTWVGEQGYLTEHQSLADYYTKEQVDSEISGATEGLASEQWVQNQGYLTEHQDISNLATKQEVNDLSGATDTKLALKADISDIPDVSNYFDNAQYDSNTKRINFYHGETIKAYVDATDFIKDGMVDNVDIETLSGSTYLVITFNTESGKEPINIPIADIFNAANYYTKSEVDSVVSGATQDMATQTWVQNQGYLTEHQDISNLATKTDVAELSSATDTKLAGKQNTLIAGEGITISGDTISSTGGGSIGPSILSGYTTVERFESAEEAFAIAIVANTDAIATKQDILIAGEGITISGNTISASGGSITIDPSLDPASPNAVANSAITEAISAKFDASGITDYYTSTEVDNAISAATEGLASETFVTNAVNELSGATDTKLSGKQDTLIAGEGISISGNTISATGGGGGGGMTEDTELLLATAITDLNDRKIDAKDVNARFQKKGSYVTTSAFNTRLADYETALDEQNVEEVTSYALNDLNNRKQDKLIAGDGISISGNTISATGGGGGGSQVQADWSQTDNTAVDYIKNKPTIPTTTSAVTSGSTACVESGAVYTQFDGMQLKKITQADYDLLPTKDSNTLYIITNSN